jgi:exodeoxyribonuclease V beta subunit
MTTEDPGRKVFRIAGAQAFDLSPGFRVIEAGAGSGKTYSLTYLVLRLVAEQGCGIDKILLVTFTEAAALELRQRLRELFEEIDGGKLERYHARVGEFANVDGAPNEKAIDAFADSAADLDLILGRKNEVEYALRRQRLAQALVRMGSMTVTTIHGFCQMAMAEHSVNAGFEAVEGVPVDAAEIAETIARDYLRVFSFIHREAPMPKLGEVVRAVRIRLGDPDCEINAVAKEKEGMPKFPGLEDFINKRRALDPVVTFDDLILNFERRLVDAKDPRSRKLTELVRARYQSCFIDESQDNDAHQWAVFRHLFVGSLGVDGEFQKAEGKSLVMVGDPKQAIYGFRGADIRTYREAVKDAGEDNVYTLPYNFRSTPGMIEGFNAIFSLKNRVTRQNFFGFETTPGGTVEGIAYEAAKWKKRKEGLPGRPIWVVKGYRPFQVAHEVNRQLKDIMPGQTIGVLVRSNANADEVHRALVTEGISAALESTQSVFDTRAAYLAGLLLSAVLKPEDTGLRRSLFLARPALFWPPSETSKDEAEGNQSIRGLGADPVDQQAQADVAAWLADCRTAWVKRGFTACWEMLSRTAPRAKKSMLGQGDEKRRVISVMDSLSHSLFRARLLIDWNHLGELLSERQAARKLDPHQLVRFLSVKIKEGSGGDDDSEASLTESLRPESEKPQVVVQTVHKSKGLEYDIVILLNKNGKGADTSPNAPGTVLKPQGTKSGVLYAGTKHDALFQEQNRKEAARLLYVAITRAKRRVVMLSPEEAFVPKELTEGTKKKKPSAYFGFFAVLWSLGVNPHTLEVDERHPDVAAANGESAADFAALKEKLSQFIQSVEPAPAAEKVSPSMAEDGLRFEIFDAARGAQGDEPTGEGDEAKPISINQRIYHARGSTSFSGLSKGRHDEGDGHFDGEGKAPRSEDAGKDLCLPEKLKGAYFGTFIHELLEDLDFAKAAQPDHPEVRKFIEDRLERSGLVSRGAPDGQFESTLGQLSRSVQLWMTMKLAPRVSGAHEPFSLAEVAPEQKLNEVRFAMKANWGYDLGSGRHQADRLADAFARHYKTADGKETPLCRLKLGKDHTVGLLIGTIDLTFSHGKRLAQLPGVSDRFFVIDWKTNHLGGKPADYGVDGLNSGIVGNLYHAQYVFYVAALDQYLSQVLGPDRWCYDFRQARPGQASFGGVYYLFLRGFGCAPEQPGYGVHYDLPPLALVREVQEILGGDVR